MPPVGELVGEHPLQLLLGQLQLRQDQLGPQQPHQHGGGRRRADPQGGRPLLPLGQAGEHGPLPRPGGPQGASQTPAHPAVCDPPAGQRREEARRPQGGEASRQVDLSSRFLMFQNLIGRRGVGWDLLQRLGGLLGGRRLAQLRRPPVQQSPGDAPGAQQPEQHQQPQEPPDAGRDSAPQQTGQHLRQPHQAGAGQGQGEQGGQKLLTHGLPPPGTGWTAGPPGPGR